MVSVVVIGGSLGGLTAALALRDAGCDVRVFERSSSALQARGAGIVVLDATLRYLTERGGYRPEDVCSVTDWIRFIDSDGSLLHERRYRNRFSSWNTLHRSLLRLFDSDRYFLGSEIVSFDPADAAGPAGPADAADAADAPTASATLADGSRVQADLLVCADGISSTARAQLMPEITPKYAGYVAWRGTLPESSLSPPARKTLGDALTYQVLDHSHILVYPIPGQDGSPTAGDRLINMVWYVNVEAGTELDRLMTGRDGARRALSLPPGAATADAVAHLRQRAAASLAQPIAELVTAIPEPFVQVVCDIEVPRMVHGRACLIGDAAFAVRPHAAAGTAKAAEDGWALAEELTAAGGDIPAALDAWERRQLKLGQTLLARTREIGDSSQFHAAFRPGDPNLIFGLHGPAN
jgi:2,6-dihydroxypyridine 3-monooxygenase